MQVKPLQITVHPGLGDFSWVYSKLVNCGRPLELTIAEDSKTKRALTYVQCLPQIADAKYGTMQDYEILYHTWNGTYEEMLKAEEEGKLIYISANNWVDKGNRLESFIPDLPTDFHYPIVTKESDKIRADQLLPILPSGDKYFGIYTSSLGGNIAWDGWSPNEWIDFISLVYKEFPSATFVLIGAKWDVDYLPAFMPKLVDTGVPYINLIGKTPDMSLSMEVLKRLDYHIGFASGMGIISNVLNKPSCMMYPSHISKLMYSWPCPISIATKDYQGFIWDRPVNIFRKIHSKLEEVL
jgi:hypothetical protein